LGDEREWSKEAETRGRKREGRMFGKERAKKGNKGMEEEDRKERRNGAREQQRKELKDWRKEAGN